LARSSVVEAQGQDLLLFVDHNRWKSIFRDASKEYLVCYLEQIINGYKPNLVRPSASQIVPRESHKVPRPLERAPASLARETLPRPLSRFPADIAATGGQQAQRGHYRGLPFVCAPLHINLLLPCLSFLFQRPRPDLQGTACLRMQSPPHNLRPASSPADHYSGISMA
jgi:hypothetical protein